MPKNKNKKRPSTSAERKAKHPATLPTEFTPRFLDDADKRQTAIRALRLRVSELREDTGADSTQKELLLRRACFISTVLETQEVEALEGKSLNIGSYVQAVNSLIGLLKCLGLERHVKQVSNLKSYVEGVK